MTKKRFHQLGLNETMLEVVEKLYFKVPTQIQRETIPAILANKSIIGESETGSGKTHAYLLPLLNDLEEDRREVQLVITVPTRELALQVFEEVKTIIKHADKINNWQARLITGGMDRERMIKQLERPPHIIVGTPGRILDMVEEGVLSIYSATSFVIDEADLMFELNFLEKIDALLVRCKKEIQLVVFSATIPQQLAIFLKKYLSMPVHIKIDQGLAPEKMEHRLIKKKHDKVHEQILQLTEIIQPYVAILFTNSKENADELARNLSEKGLDIGVLHGGLSSRERKRIVKAILDHHYQYIVATDLASRGIDIKGTSHVINVELPKEIDFYIHRVGRTARAGLSGTAISFYSEDDLPLIEKLEAKGIKIHYSDIKNGELVDAKHFDERQRRKQVTTSIEKEAWKRVKKPKKIKPGYRKKMKQEQERIKRQLLQKKRRQNRRHKD